MFSRSCNRQHEVIIGGEDNDWDSYRTRYRRAATVLVNHITQKHYHSQRRDYSRYWEAPAYDDVQPEVLEPETLKDIETAERIIAQFDEIDRKSQVFRYPVDKAGRVTVPPI